MTTTIRPPAGPSAGPLVSHRFAPDTLSFLLMDPLTQPDPAALGSGPQLVGLGERSAMGMVDAQGATVARADILVGPAGLGQWWLRVRPELRGRGIGGALLDASCRHARLMGARCLHAQLRSGDTRSVHLLRRAGTPRTLHVDVAYRSVCVHLIVGGACGGGAAAPPQCLCSAALRPHPPHRAQGRAPACS